MASIKLTGDTSGVITVSAPAAAGTNTITLPASTGTMALTSDITTEIPSQTGNSGKYLTTNGSASSWGTVASGGFTTLGSVTISGTPTDVTFASINCSLYKFLVFSVAGLLSASIANPIFKLGSLNATTGAWLSNLETGGTMDGLIWLDTSNNSGMIVTGNYMAIVSPGDTGYGSIGAGIRRMIFSKGSDIQAQTNADIVFTIAGGVAFTAGNITLYGVS